VVIAKTENLFTLEVLLFSCRRQLPAATTVKLLDRAYQRNPNKANALAARLTMDPDTINVDRLISSHPM
jgi:hypothetical protein